MHDIYIFHSRQPLGAFNLLLIEIILTGIYVILQADANTFSFDNEIARKNNQNILANVYINIALPFPFPDWLYANSKAEM